VPHRAVVEEEVVEEGMCDNHASVCKLEDRSYPIRSPHLGSIHVGGLNGEPGSARNSIRFDARTDTAG